MSPSEACTATAGTAAPAPAAAPATPSGGWAARKTAESSRIKTRPGPMKHNPPTRAPYAPRNRQAA